MKGIEMKRKLSVKLYQIIMLGFLLSGCSTVPVNLAPGLAPEARATLAGSSPVFLMQVDDERGSDESGFNYKNISGSYVFYLSPGKHTLIIGYKFIPKKLLLAIATSPNGVSYERISTELGIIQFEAKPGHSYTLVGEDTWETWKVSLQDNTTEQNITNLPNFTGGILRTRTCVSTPNEHKCDCNFR